MTIDPTSAGRHAPSSRLAGAALVAAGAMFAAYPALRPFSSEQGLDGARAFASSSWLVAHSLAIVAFVLVGLAVSVVARRLEEGRSGRLARRAAMLTGAGIGLTLPFYGAEVFGLHAIGQEALDRDDPTLVAMSDSVRLGVGIGFIVVGLLLAALGTGMLARAIWRSGTMARSSGLLLAVGLALYLPQFSAPQPVRVAHGLLVLAGCVTLARGVRGAARHGATTGAGTPTLVGVAP